MKAILWPDGDSTAIRSLFARRDLARHARLPSLTYEAPSLPRLDLHGMRSAARSAAKGRATCVSSGDGRKGRMARSHGDSLSRKAPRACAAAACCGCPVDSAQAAPIGRRATSVSSGGGRYGGLPGGGGALATTRRFRARRTVRLVTDCATDL